MKYWTQNKESYKAFVKWNHHKNFKTFIEIYKNGFTGGFCLWKIYKIFRNTLNGTYKYIENNFVLKER